MTEYLRSLMLIQMGNSAQVEVVKDLRESMKEHAAAFATARVIRLIRAFNAAAADTRGGWQPSLALELALAEAMEDAADASSAEPGASQGGQAARRAPAPAPEPSQPGASKRDLNTEIQSSPVISAPASPRRDFIDPGQSSGNAAEVNEPVIELAQVIGAWKEIRGALKRTHPAADGLLNSCKPIDLRGTELVLGFQTDAVRAIMDRPENMEAARKAIADVLGRPLEIRCLVINTVGKAPPNMAQDGMIATALNHGGEIVDIQE